MLSPYQRFSAVCMRGHVIEDLLGLEEATQVMPNCRRCGAPVLTECSDCSARILGHRPIEWMATDDRRSRWDNWQWIKRVFLGRHRPDPFCWNCGKPYPWATREQRIGHLYNLIDFQDDLDEADRLTITEQVAVLSKPEASDEQRIKAGNVIKRLAPKMWEAALPILQTVLSAEIRRQLL